MEKEIIDRFKKLPQFVRDAIYEDNVKEAIRVIREDYVGNDKLELEAMKDIIGLTILKDLKMEDLVGILEKDFGYDEAKSKGIALIIFRDILYPIKDYYPGVEDEILKLGGEIPKGMPKKLDEQLLKREEEMEEIREIEEKKEEEAAKDMIVSLPITELAKEYPQVESQQIGSQESIIVEGSDVPMKPEIKYWMKDYMEKAGYHMHSNLDRVQYVYHDKNTKNMNEEERRQLGLVLKSLDEEMPLPYSTKRGKIDFSKIIEE